MLSEPDTGQCSSEEVEPRKGWTRGDANKDAGPGVPHRLDKEMSASENAGTRRGVDYEIPHRLGRKTKHSL